ncbi:MAG: hypothetical protein ACI4TK_09150 [Agathobacter sp.]
MKKYISVFEMITRSTLYKVLAVLVIMGALQFSLFWGELQEYDEIVEGGMGAVVDQSHMIVLLATGFLLITVILCWSGCNLGSNQGYTLRRLQITEKKILVLQAVYNSMIYILLWGSQVLVLLLESSLYLQKIASPTNQTLVLAFYKNAYMHSILPMEDILGWILLLLIIAGCGITSALFPYRQRRGNVSFGIIAAVGTTLIVFPKGIGGDLSFLIYYPSLLLIVYGIYNVIVNVNKIKEESKHEEN